MQRRISKIFGPLIAVTMFCLALYALQSELKDFSYKDVSHEFRHIKSYKLALAGLFTLISYFLLTFYDVLGLRYAGAKINYARTALVSFLAYTFSHNLGFSILTGGSIRFRLLSAWGLNPLEIARLLGFIAVSFWFGFCAALGLALLINPPDIAQSVLFPNVSLRIVGALLLGLVGVYLAFSAKKKNLIKIKDFEIQIPKLSISVPAIMVSICDWTIASMVAYVLVPHKGVSPVEFLGLFLVSQIAGLISHVPGGLGVFESIMVLALSKGSASHGVLGALLAYRIIYYLIPLSISLAIIIARESWTYGDFIWALTGKLTKRAGTMVPFGLSVFMFFAGSVLLFSGATPPVAGRFDWLEAFIPDSIVEASHFLASVVGMAMLLLARGIQRKLDAAYILSLGLVALGIITSLLKGFDWEEASLLTLLFVILLRSRKLFYRNASLLSQPFEPVWLFAMAVTLAATTWLIFFSFKHVEYSNQLWWEFSFSGHAPRALRALVGACAVGSIWGLLQLVSPARPDPGVPSPEGLDMASKIALESQHTYAHLALLGDKAFLFNAAKNGFVMFALEGKSYVAMGDPVCKEEDLPDLIWSFRELADRHDAHCVFYQIHEENIPYYLDVGLDLLKLGEEAIVDLADFGLEGKARSGLRHTKNRFIKEGFELSIIPQAEVSRHLDTLKQISDNWLKDKSTREKGFSLGFFKYDYLLHQPVAVIKKGDRIVAFANMLCSGDKNELSVDLMRYLQEAPSGVMEFLFVELMLWGKEQGYKTFNVGMAPLAGLEQHKLAPFWNKLGNLLYSHGEHFYNFQGVRNYKEKFHPRWEGRYLASPGGLTLPRVFTNVTSLISGGIRGVLTR